MFKALGSPWGSPSTARNKAASSTELDCQACGACCCNTERNSGAAAIASGTTSREYVEVEAKDPLFKRKDLLEQLAVKNADGVFHLRLVGDEQRCVALDGDLGEGVGCEIYALRPTGCRQVEAGDEECLRARRFRGLSIAPITPPVTSPISER